MHVVEILVLSVLVILFALLLWACVGFALMIAWNGLIATNFAVPMITFWQGFAVAAFLTVIRLLF